MLENTTIILIIGAAWVFFLLNIIIFHFFGKRRSLLSLVNGQNSENWILVKILRAVLKSENLSCIAVDAEGRISLVNPAAKKIFNNALKGRHYEEVFPETTGLNDLIGRVLIGGESFYEEIKINLEEKDYFLHIIFEAVKDRHGKTSGAVLFFKDITEEKARELADREEEKLTAVKQLAAGVAHEMRQPLTVIKGFAQLLQKEVGDSVKLNSFCRVIVNEMDRMNEIIADFIELANPPCLSTSKISLNKIVQDCALIIKDRCQEKDIKVKLKLAKFLPEIEADEAKIKQAMMSIIDNALDAMEGKRGGILTFATGREKNGVFLSITDTGTGIPEKRISKVLEPFYSTKNNGSGLGLSVAKSIMERHSGELEIKSQVGKGTTVKLKFPRFFCWAQNYLLVEDL